MYVQYTPVLVYVHSAIVYSISNGVTTLYSKWGAGPLVKHTSGYSPYVGKILYYK